MTDALNGLASRWTGVPGLKDTKDFDQVLATWERVYRQRFPAGPSIARSEAGEQRRIPCSSCWRMSCTRTS